MIEIELFSYCNRRCSFCPNRELDRKGRNHLLEVSVLKGLLHELKTEGYQGVLSFSRYNEPMSRNSLFKKRLRQIKEILPDNKLVTNTNGDFLSKAALDGLLIDELTVMDYDCLGIERCLDRLKKVNAVIEEVAYPYIHATRSGMDILYFVDWPEWALVSDRGGSLNEYGKVRRTVPCLSRSILLVSIMTVLSHPAVI